MFRNNTWISSVYPWEIENFILFFWNMDQLIDLTDNWSICLGVHCFQPSILRSLGFSFLKAFGQITRSAMRKGRSTSLLSWISKVGGNELLRAQDLRNAIQVKIITVGRKVLFEELRSSQLAFRRVWPLVWKRRYAWNTMLISSSAILFLQCEWY